ncbi:MAG TPA: RNA polymerase sigma factor, partial [Xanthobacteraceae bacterium]|nr:RNA polymerase sigma factor [Xanthobacteraceae bacterium]
MVMERQEATRVIDLDALGDAQLVQLALQRDSGAFRLIMRRHNRRLYRVARAVTRDDNEAEDVVQEAYCLAFANLSRFRGDSSLASWLTRIALNEALGRLRRRRPTVELSTLDAESQDEMRIISFPLTTANADPERAVAQREIRRLMERAIDDLPETFRMVFVMREIEELSVEETADFLGIPQATVKTRLHRAHRLLRQTLDEQLAPA